MIYLILTCVFLAGAILGYALDRWWHERPFRSRKQIPMDATTVPPEFALKMTEAITAFGEASRDSFEIDLDGMAEAWGKGCDAFRESLARYGFGPDDEDDKR